MFSIRAAARTPPKARTTRSAGGIDVLFMGQHFAFFASLKQLICACLCGNGVAWGLGMPIDHEWFTTRLADRGLSQRRLAKLMGIDPSAVSLMLRGMRRMTVDKAAQIAVLLQSTTTDVMEAAGVPITGGDRVPITGILLSDGHVEQVAEGLHDNVEAPPGLPVGAAAIQARTSSLEDGWLYFVSAEHGKPDAAVGQLALVAIRDNGLRLAHVRRGYRRGAFNLVDTAGRAFQSVELAWASPVFWIRTSPH